MSAFLIRCVPVSSFNEGGSLAIRNRNGETFVDPLAITEYQITNFPSFNYRQKTRQN